MKAVLYNGVVAGYLESSRDTTTIPLPDGRSVTVGERSPLAAFPNLSIVAASNGSAVPPSSSQAFDAFSDDPALGVIQGDGTVQRPALFRDRTLSDAQRAARDRIDAAYAAAVNSGIDYLLPAGSTQDGVDASGQTIQILLVHPDVPSYWNEFEARVRKTGAYATEEFDAKGAGGRELSRISVPGTEIEDIFVAVATAAGQQRTAGRRFESDFRLASSTSDYDAILPV